ncbi:hypothetical protein [Geminisphaera colitermitum]|uniref:hypothetical protein n=1 Tax=Geminisphaera colitermitum TaxID=1148786 RepID=UPI000158C99B|nr:hypothetical protein [Geminisphaera colitermitum]
MNTTNTREWRQAAWITAGAAALFFAARWLPTGTNLSHQDFRVDGPGMTGAGGASIEFCDPANPQFLPVVAVRSPVVTTLRTADAAPVQQDRETRFVLTLATSGGKPIGPADLVLMHTRKLHLMVVDPTLEDYQHLHPEPGERDGEWTFIMTPYRSGNYRAFADFTPLATGRGLYASAEFEVHGGRVSRPAIAVTKNEYTFTLKPAATPIRAGQQAKLTFSVTRDGGAGPVPLEPVMDAYAHLVAFDEARSGFAHLHPQENDPLRPPDPVNPRLTFALTIPQPGRYVIWSQTSLAGHETYVPFWFKVEP